MEIEIKELLQKAPPSKFVNSLSDFFEQNRYLSDKQISVLRDIIATKKVKKSFNKSWTSGIDHDECCEFTGEVGGVDWGI
jgi:hypothetical protein